MSDLTRAARRLLMVVLSGLAGSALLAGSASAAGALSVDPSEVDLGAHGYGGLGAVTVTVTNQGPDAVQLSEIALIGDVDPFEFGDGSCLPDLELVATGTCQVELLFSPLGFQPATHDATLVVAGGDDDEPGVADVTARTTGSVPLTTHTPTVYFGPWVNPHRGVRATAYVSNVSGHPVAIDAPVVSPPFRVTESDCEPGLYAGEGCSVEMAIDPPSGSNAPPQSGTLTVRAGDYELVVQLLARWTFPFPHVPAPPRQLPAWSPKQALTALTAAVPGLVRGGPSGWRTLPSFKPGAPGRLSLALFGARKGKLVRIGGGAQRFTLPIAGQMRFKLNKAGVALLRRPQRTRIRAVARFEPDSTALGTAAQHTAEYRVKAPKKKRKRR